MQPAVGPLSPAQLAELRKKEDNVYSALRSKNLAAAGVLIGCTDAKTGEALLLFGIDSKDHFCHFHGKNDEQKSNPDERYLDTALDTAVREYAEESLEIVGSEKEIRDLLASRPECYLQIFPHSSYNVRCYFLFLGSLKDTQRDAILAKFKKSRSNLFLKPNQREMDSLVWIRGTELIRAYSADSWTSEQRTVVTCLGMGGHSRAYKSRSWLQGWFRDVFYSYDAPPETVGLRVFRDWCRAGGVCPVTAVPDSIARIAS